MRSFPMRAPGAAATPGIVTTSAGGDTVNIPSAVLVALFAFLATWPVARYGLRQRQS